MEERARRIVESAVELAEKGGFEAVRLRDVAAHAGVALGTLYRRFRSKEDLLLAALEQEIADHQQRLMQRPPKGDTPAASHARVVDLVTLALRGDMAPEQGAASTADERVLARSLQMVWFASLVGWSGGLHGQAGIVEQTRTAAQLMLSDRGD
jgi:AcrR family transcriptional regulator